MQYFYSHDGSNRQGPVTLEQLRQASISATTVVWYEGLSEWTPADKLPELADLFDPGALGASGGSAGSSSAPVPPQPPPPPTGYVAYAPVNPQQRTNPMAMTSMILGIVGLVLLPCLFLVSIVPSALAVIFGHIGRSQIRKGNGVGGGFALTGLILGYISVGLTVALVGLYLAVQAYSANANAKTRVNAAPSPAQPIPRVPAVPAMPPSRPMPTFPDIPKPGNGGQGN